MKTNKNTDWIKNHFASICIWGMVFISCSTPKVVSVRNWKSDAKGYRNSTNAKLIIEKFNLTGKDTLAIKNKLGKPDFFDKSYDGKSIVYSYFIDKSYDTNGVATVAEGILEITFLYENDIIRMTKYGFVLF